ncbi:hypothetical protein HOG48_04670 [Candidatus Peregrinibacteria bacterium]|jgi:hypothetical protein|nr:hypothetical protein [Candidatus Peregrinibacteria bacterium]
MKKAYAILLIFTLVLLISACGDKDKTIDEVDIEPRTESEALAESMTDRGYFEEALNNSDVTYCDKIKFRTLKDKCFLKIEE